MQLAKGNVVVTLDGQGADEELAGYMYFYGFFFKDLLRQGKFGLLNQEMAAYARVHRSSYGCKAFLYFLLPQSVRTKVRQNEYGYVYPEFANTFASSNSIAGNLYGSKSLNDALLDHFEYKLEHLLKWDDRNSMANSIESRVPFLDYQLVERTMATPNTEKINNGVTKFILRESMKGTLPEKIRNRQDKIGFDTPQDEWFRTPGFQNFLEGIINSQSFAERGYFNVDKVKSLYQRHLSHEISISKEIWKWVNMELWYRRLLNNE